MRRRAFVVAFIGALVALLVGGLPDRAAAQTAVTVSNVTELEAAVLAARGGGSVDIRLRAGTYDLQSRLDLSVSAGNTATVRNFGNGPVILTNDGSFRTGFVTGVGTYVFRGLTFAGSFQSIDHSGGDLAVFDSTFTGNQLAIYTDSGDANITVVNSTFWDNGATCRNFCGGIRLDSHASSTITNSTFVGNGIGIYGLVSVDTVTNTLLLANLRDCVVQETTATFSHSVDGDGTCAAATTQATTYALGSQSVAPGFGDHGGLVPTWLHTVLTPDPALKAGSASCTPFDARGGVRSSPCDVGALEVTREFNVESTTGVGPVTFTVSAGSATGFRAVNPALVPDGNLPDFVTFPFGLFEWTVSSLTPGQSLSVTMTFPSAIAAPLKYWKGSLAVGPWTDLCVQTTCTQPSPNQISFTLVDGGVGDLDGVANGTIHDPSGFGVGGDAPTEPNLTITKAVRDGGALVNAVTVNNGATAIFRLAVFNTGTGPTRAPIAVTDMLNASLGFVAAGSDPRCSAVGPQVTCASAGPLAAGASDAFDVAVRVASNAAPIGAVVSITNTAVVSTLHDSDPTDDTSNVVVLTVVGAAPPNLRVQKRIMVGANPSAGPVTVSQGATVTYQLQVSNAGAGATAGTTLVTDALDPRLSFVVVGSDARCSAAGAVVTCAASGVIPAGGTDTFTIVTQVSGAITPTGSAIVVPNSATVSTPSDAVPGDDTSNSVVLNVTLGTATAAGTGITVQPVSDIGAPQPVTVTFNSVTTPGFTTAIPSTAGPALPVNLQRASPYYDIFSTARFTTPVSVCVTGQFAGVPTLLQLDNGNWVTLANQQALPVSGPPFTTVCATTTTSLMPVVVGIANTPTTPAPTLTRMTPDSGRRGTYAIVLFQGTGFGRTPTLQMGDDIRVVEVLSFTPTVAGALVYIRPTAVRGPRNVTVTTDGGISNPLNFTVR